MQRSFIGKRFGLSSKADNILGVSEAVGTVLLLGISVMLAGGVALWTQTIEEGEEGIYVDLWANIQGSDLVITHRGGDFLDGSNTYITVKNSDGTEALAKTTYYSQSGTNDNNWGPGEELRVDISGSTDSIDIIVTTVKGNGVETVILSSTLVKDTAGAVLPDLAITQVYFEQTDGTTITSMYETGTNIIGIRVDNVGANMANSYFNIDPTDNTVSNLRLFDTMDQLRFDSVSASFYDSSAGTTIAGDGNVMEQDDYYIFEFEWRAYSDDPRTLGMHKLNVKVVPLPGGEINYRNNYVERSFKVNKEVKPMVIHGPDPGIYDVSFSDESPHSGDEVTVTVIIQNSGDEPVELSHNVNMVVTTYKPKIMTAYNSEMYDWRMDSDYGMENHEQWRSNKNDHNMTDDNNFPTCVKTDIQLLPGAYFFYYFTLEAQVDIPGGQQMVYALMDVFNSDDSEDKIQGIDLLSGDNPDDNRGVGLIQVLPKIMVVDDDESIPGSPGDMTSTVMESLIGSGVSLDRVYITQQVEDSGDLRDAPAYDYSQDEIAAPAMKDYDIVIWVTGYVENPLTNKPEGEGDPYTGNIQELKKYLDANNYLMMVGESPFEYIANNYFIGGDVRIPKGKYNPTNGTMGSYYEDVYDFLYKYLGIQEIQVDEDLPTDYLVGLDTSEDGITESEGSYEIEMASDLPADNDGMQWLTPRSEDLTDEDFEFPERVLTTQSESSGDLVNTLKSTSLLRSYIDIADSGDTYRMTSNIIEDNPPFIVQFDDTADDGIGVTVSQSTETDTDDSDSWDLITITYDNSDGGSGNDATWDDIKAALDSYPVTQFELNIPTGGGSNYVSTTSSYGWEDYDSASGNTDNSADFNWYSERSQFRVVTATWDINQIRYLNEKVKLLSGVLQWFDWDIHVGRDLAVTKMELSIKTEQEDGTWVNEPLTDDNPPKYLDTILIEVTVRNNGPQTESTSLIFYVTGPDGVELPITSGIPDPSGEIDDDDNPQDISNIESDGGEYTTYKLWLAIGVGEYTFRVVVDPYHLIDEINEENNDITYSTSTITSFVTQNNILVVDDDQSLNDNFPSGDDGMGIDYSGIGGEPSAIIENILTDFNYDHEVHTVEMEMPGGSWTMEDMDSGLSILDLKRYNSIIWVTGDAGNMHGTIRESLTDNDLIGLYRYLNGDYPEADYLPEDHHENVMFIGQNMVPDLLEDASETVTGDSGVSFGISEFMENYIGIESGLPSVSGSSDYLHGPNTGRYVEDIFVGVEYGPDDFSSPFSFSSLEKHPSSDARQETRYGLNTTSGGNVYNVGIQNQWYEEIGSNPKYYRTIIHSWQASMSDHSQIESSLYEMIYLSMHWFSTPEDQPEIVSRSDKITIDNENPVLGNSYLVNVEIVNIGGVSGGGTVRFSDGNTLIKSENIYLEPDVTTTLEAIWTPLYAGQRTLLIEIDKYDDYDEVFDEINNKPEETIRVYFFWDDMESGDGNWQHDANVVRINGEGKLDYMEEPTYSNVDNQWEVMDGFQMNTDVDNERVSSQSHSSPNSYFMHEPEGNTRTPIDVVLDLDSSGSMTWNDPADLRKQAARNFIDRFQHGEDRASVYDFDSSVTRITDLTYDLTSAKSSIGYLDSNGGTELYDSGYEALDYLGNNGRGEAVKALIILTDGEDTQSERSLSEYSLRREEYDGNPGTETKIFVFTIQVIDGDEETLKSMCTQPWDDDEGPFYFMVNNPEALENVFQTIADIVEGAAQSATRGSDVVVGPGSGSNSGPTRGGNPTRSILFSDDFPTTSLDLNKWSRNDASIDPVGVEYNSTPYSVELAETQAITSSSIDLSRAEDATISFWWRGFRGDPPSNDNDDGNEGNDRFYLDIRVSGGWLSGYYLINDGCHLMTWRGENIVLPESALWSGFQMRFRADTNYGREHDAYYLDDVELHDQLITGDTGVEGFNPWSDGTAIKRDKYLETGAIDMRDVDEASMSFYHKYNLEVGANGGVILVGTSDTEGGLYQYRYVRPNQPYTGNILTTEWENRKDDYGTPMAWCWNGISGGGTLDWDFISVNLDHFTGSWVKLKFLYIHTYGGTGYGWMIDDVSLTVTTDNDGSLDTDSADNWVLQSDDSMSGDHSWYNGDYKPGGVSNGDFVSGTDNSLYTRPVDLTNARKAYMQAHLKFNINDDAGRPPDGFRVEVSKDNGVSWIPLSLGVRSSWKVSGSQPDGSDGVIDGKSYTGIDEGDSWIKASSLTRLNTNLNGFIGNVVIIRFRVVVNTDNPFHYEDSNMFRGFYLDDVVIYGESLEGTRIQEEEREPVMDQSNYKEDPSVTKSDPDAPTVPIDPDPEMSDHEVVYKLPDNSYVIEPINLVIFFLLITSFLIVVRRRKR